MLRDDANVISHAGGGRQEERLAICKHIGGAKTSLSICVWTDGGGTSSFGAADETDKSIGSPSHQLPFRANRWKDGRTDARTDAMDGRERGGHERASQTYARAPLAPPLPSLPPVLRLLQRLMWNSHECVAAAAAAVFAVALLPLQSDSAVVTRKTELRRRDWTLCFCGKLREVQVMMEGGWNWNGREAE